MLYEKRIKTSGLNSYQIRRKRGDIIQQYKIESRLDWHIKPQKKPTLADSTGNW
jgi:hypothetical protein